MCYSEKKWLPSKSCRALLCRRKQNLRYHNFSPQTMIGSTGLGYQQVFINPFSVAGSLEGIGVIPYMCISSQVQTWGRAVRTHQMSPLRRTKLTMKLITSIDLRNEYISQSLSQDTLQQAETRPYVLITLQGTGSFCPLITEKTSVIEWKMSVLAVPGVPVLQELFPA